MSSLKEQLLKAGLVKPNAVKNKPKKKAPTQAKKARKKVSPETQRAQRAMLDKAKRDRKLNQQRAAQAEKKALFAQIKQLVDQSKLERNDGEVSYSFTHRKKIKRLYVTANQQTQLASGQLSIVHLNGENYELVPTEIGMKIMQRDPQRVIQTSTPEHSSNEDDPYADYEVPDDLTW